MPAGSTPIRSIGLFILINNLLNITNCLISEFVLKLLAISSKAHHKKHHIKNSTCINRHMYVVPMFVVVFSFELSG